MSTSSHHVLEILTRDELRRVQRQALRQWPCERRWGTLIVTSNIDGAVRYAVSTNPSVERRLKSAVQGPSGRLVPRKTLLMVEASLVFLVFLFGSARWTASLFAVLTLCTTVEAIRAGWFRPITFHHVRAQGELERLLALEASGQDHDLLARMIAAGRDWESLEQPGAADLVHSADHTAKLANTAGRPDYGERIAALVIDATTPNMLAAAQTALDDLYHDLEPLAEARREEANQTCREAKSQAAAEYERAVLKAHDALAGPTRIDADLVADRRPTMRGKC
ncbi:hypothetical protein [Luteococcus sp.]|uniref:hypothetical protein n=1 Tax=Luteococcus sp. TaxID=1969402 RepID=UPI00373571F2